MHYIDKLEQGILWEATNPVGQGLFLEDIKIRLGWIGVRLRKKLSPIRMETVWEILPFAEHQALFFSERYGCAYPSLCLSGGKYG
ncbi:hypothetical protein DXB41_12685 [Segatella copri]|uniref:Uncharacterized protein n=1 Tax=Segatella copri TaxID=165179 RepID=A0A3E5DVM1_9BACT|nr:hypothetical protein DXB41_12685 [Segatella copri]RGS19832.1 hypothetical protein DWY11_01035 [Segatella copri]